MEDDIRVIFGKFIREIINDTTVTVALARSGFIENNYNANALIVDSLSPGIPIDEDQSYVGSTENPTSGVMTYSTRFEATITVDAYGANAHTNILKLHNAKRTYEASQYMKANNITVYDPSEVIDLNLIVGTQNYTRLQSTFTVLYTRNITEQLPTIATSNVQIFTEE